MQMILLAFAVIAVCSAHLKCYTGNTFKLQGGRGINKSFNNGLKLKMLRIFSALPCQI